MEIRIAKLEDLEQIKSIFEHARNFMVQNGNTVQWQNKQELYDYVLRDIENGNCYVYIDDEKIAATFCFFIGKEPTYDKIYEGSWLNDEAYGVIHRIAVAVHQKGIASKCIQWCLNQYPNIKIDTYKDNIPMQKTILKNGFIYCGIIKKPDGTDRLAYQSSGLKIVRYDNKFQNDIIKLVLHCQNDGTRPVVGVENQPEIVNIEDYFFSNGGYFWCATDKNDLAGIVALKNYGNNICGLKKFFVWEQYRGNPYYLGQKLYSEFIKYAKEKKFNTIVLSTPKNTVRAHKFYLKAEFKLVNKSEIPVEIDAPYSESDYFICTLD